MRRLGVVLAAVLMAAGCSKDRKAEPNPAETPSGPAAPPAQAGIKIDPAARSVSIRAVVAEQGAYSQLAGAIEYVLVAAEGKEYETIFVTDQPPERIVEALRSIGLRTGRPATRDAPPRGLPVLVLAEFEQAGRQVRRPVDELILHGPTDRPLTAGPWLFTGSTQASDPASGRAMLGAALTGSVIGLHYGDASAVLQNPRAECRNENIYKARAAALPPAGASVRIIFQRPAASAGAAGRRRVYVLARGRLAGVGYPEFVERQGRQFDLAGFVRAMPDGGVELLAEGPAEPVGRFIEAVRVGPRAARVEGFEPQDEPPEGDLGPFEIWE